MRRGQHAARPKVVRGREAYSVSKFDVKTPTSTITILCILCLFSASMVLGQAQHDPSAETQTIPLWENGAPGALGQGDDDRPTLTLYRPWRPNLSGTAVIVAPGGGYGGLASNHEGRQVANWFNAMGLTAFVLKYRLGPPYHHPIELGDAQRAIRLVRSRAKEFDVSPGRIGMMGFSAGGHLASTAATHFGSGNPGAADPIDRAGSRPDFVILGYPVITLEPPYVNVGSAKNLLGDNPDPKLVQELSNELHVTPQTSPTFLLTTSDDNVVAAENSVSFYLLPWGIRRWPSGQSCWRIGCAREGC
jgi:acetyl esterase/lipase